MPDQSHPADARASDSPASLVFCGHCGGTVDGKQAAGAAGRHDSCARRLALEPPRYCRACRRRMKVQVHPFGWDADCSRHGRTTS